MNRLILTIVRMNASCAGRGLKTILNEWVVDEFVTYLIEPGGGTGVNIFLERHVDKVRWRG